MKKKVLSALLIIVMILGVTGCGKHALTSDEKSCLVYIKTCNSWECI